jgi:hypothetical protein
MDNINEIPKYEDSQNAENSENKGVNKNENKSTIEIKEEKKESQVEVNPDKIVIEEENKVQGPLLNQDYYDEFNRPKYEDITKFENEIRAEIEQNSPLVSDKLDVHFLTAEFADSIFVNSVKEITDKYKYIRTVRRDGNCFYRSFMFRLFEELSLKKQSSLYNSVLKVVEDSKSLCEKNGYQWLVLEDFYNMFISEWKFVYQLDPLNTSEYM